MNAWADLSALDAEIAEVRRELALRHSVYPGLVAKRRMTQADADRQVALLKAVRDRLCGLRDTRRAALEPGLPL